MVHNRGMSRAKVFVHVGAPKTGTTYLQDRLSRNAQALSRQGIHFPSRALVGEAARFHFQAALDLLGQDWGGDPGHAEGAWPAMVRQVRRKSGTVVISHEILAPAPAESIQRLKDDLAGHDLHVVYTARDLARQVPAAWQESIKQGRGWSYAKFLTRVRAGRNWFMRAFDLPNVLEAWGAGLPPENVHVITVPPSGAGPDVLWDRFCDVVGIARGSAPEQAERINASMGIEQAQVLRRLNRRLGCRDPRDPDNELDRLVGTLVEAGTFAGGSRRIELPPAMQEWAAQQAAEWVDWLQRSGTHVVGDAEELRPAQRDPDAKWRNPDKPGKRRLAAVSLDVLEAVARVAAERPAPRSLAPRVRAGLHRITP